MSKSALEGRRGNVFWLDPFGVVIVGIDTEDGPDHPLYDVTDRHQIDEGMVLSILDIGVKETILVRKVADDNEPKGYRVEIVDGRRRVLHAREAHERAKKSGDPSTVLVPAMLDRGNDRTLEKVSVALNSIRRDDLVMAKAEKAARMLRRNGGDYTDVAIAMGVTEKTIRTYEKLDGGAGAKLRKAINEGSISASAAVRLCDLPSSKQDEELKNLLEKSGGKRVTIRKAEKAKNGKPSAPSKKVLKKLVQRAHEDTAMNVSPDFITGVRFALGEIEPAEVGIDAVIEEIQSKRKT